MKKLFALCFAAASMFTLTACSEDYSSKIDDLENRLEEAEKENANLKQILEDLQNLVGKIESDKIAELLKSIEKLVGENSNLKDQITYLKTSLRNASNQELNVSVSSLTTTTTKDVKFIAGLDSMFEILDLYYEVGYTMGEHGAFIYSIDGLDVNNVCAGAFFEFNVNGGWAPVGVSSYYPAVNDVIEFAVNDDFCGEELSKLPVSNYPTWGDKFGRPIHIVVTITDIIEDFGYNPEDGISQQGDVAIKIADFFGNNATLKFNSVNNKYFGKGILQVGSTYKLTLLNFSNWGGQILGDTGKTDTLISNIKFLY